MVCPSVGGGPSACERKLEPDRFVCEEFYLAGYGRTLSTLAGKQHLQSDRSRGLYHSVIGDCGNKHAFASERTAALRDETVQSVSRAGPRARAPPALHADANLLKHPSSVGPVTRGRTNSPSWHAWVRRTEHLGWDRYQVDCHSGHVPQTAVSRLSSRAVIPTLMLSHTSSDAGFPGSPRHTIVVASSTSILRVRTWARSFRTLLTDRLGRPSRD